MVGITSFKGRNIEGGENVRVYYDLHRGKFSIQIKTLVYGKADAVLLLGATFKVNENDRLKVVATGVKNVHAKVHGKLVQAAVMSSEDLERQGFREADYNPFKYDSFVDKETKEPITQADFVQLQHKRIFYAVNVNK